VTASPGERARRGALAALLAVHLAVSTFGVVPGHLSVDETVYHQATRDLVATGSLGLQTGYEELGSPELANLHIWVHDGRVVPSYPYLFPALAAPFFALLGYRGLFVLNALAFVGVALSVYALARRLFADRVVALDATLLFSLGTFAWEYSQAAWPHALSLLFVTGAVLLAVVALQASGPRALGAALAAGVVAGLAPGVRLDAVVALPAVLLPLLFARPARPREAALAIAGAVPGLALLSLTNLAKFGSANPLSYGSPFTGGMFGVYLPGIALAGVALAAAWLLTRERARPLLARHGRALAAGLALVALACGAIPAVRAVTGWTWALAIDLRALDADRVSTWVPRTPGGGLVYVDGLKHSLLQSLPWLAILAVFVVRGRDRGARGALALLAVVPVMAVAENCLWGHDGGLSLNLRLMLHALPFLAILGAYLGHELARAWGKGPSLSWSSLAAGAAAALFAALVAKAGAVVIRTGGALGRVQDWSQVAKRVLVPDLQGVEPLEVPILVIPLVLAAGLVALVCAGEWLREGRAREVARQGAWAALAAAIAWAGLVALVHDYPRHRARRAENWAIGGAALSLVPPGSLLFTSDFPDSVLRLLERDGVLLAYPYEDRFADFTRLVEVALASGRRVFAAQRQSQWQAVLPLLPRGTAPASFASPGADVLIAEIVRAPASTP
jgi:hypothetical protein